MKSKWNILVADDHPAIIQAISNYLKTFIWCNCVYHATNGEEVLTTVKNQPIDLVILDHRMPILDGYHTSLLLKENFPRIKIIIYSQYDNPSLIDKYMEAGVHGYMVKKSLDIERAITNVMNGQFFLSESPDQYPPSKRPAQFSENELSILKLLSTGKNSDEISREMNLSIHSVHTYRKRLVKKFKVQNIPELIHYAHEIGVL